MKPSISALKLVLVLVIFTLSCSLNESRKTALLVGENFHNYYNSKQYKEIYLLTSEILRQNASESDFIDYLKNMNQKFGEWKNSAPMSYQIHSASSGTNVTIIYSSEFTIGKVTEKFVWNVQGQNVLLVRYQTDPDPVDN